MSSSSDGGFSNVSLADPDAEKNIEDDLSKTDNHVAFEQIQSEDRFSEQFSDDEAYTINFSGNLARKQYTKLEIVRASQIKTLLNWHHGFIGAAVVLIMIIVILLNTRYKYVFGHQDLSFTLTVYETPAYIQWISYIFDYVNYTIILLLCLVFCQRILRLRSSQRTHEQVWVMMLLISMVLYLFPYQAIFKAHDLLVHRRTPARWWSLKSWFYGMSKFYDITRTTAFTASTIFYIWANIHSYRILDGKIRPKFYLFKCLLMLFYISSKVAAFFSSDIYSAEAMFVTFFGMVSLFPSAFSKDLSEIFPKTIRAKILVPGISYALSLFCFEIMLAIWIGYEVIRTKRCLKTANYLQYRSKQVGFRFFLYHNLTFYAMFLLLHIVLVTSMPNGGRIFALAYQDPPQIFFATSDFLFGTNILLLAYVFVEAYVNLPADAIGFRGWFNPQSSIGQVNAATDLKPITYRKKEPPSLNGAVPDFNTNCFVMQTHVTMFNFSWLVYYWGTPKAEKFQVKQNVFKFSIDHYVKDEDTDTHVLIVSGEDRIVVAFKGTTSVKNLKTDLRMFYRHASSILPTQSVNELEDPEGEETSGGGRKLENSILRDRAWKHAKIHKGFATAYAAVAPRIVSILQMMQAGKRRPIFLTGHSLGGALATICSFDLLLRNDISRDEVFVSTFGAPRVGNKNFMELYDKQIPLHWRIVVGPDVIAKLPKVGYSHVGKKVLITSDGDLFIDPNSLELNMWSGEVASFIYHRKASYLLAMRAWCERHHGDKYVPEFWPWPTSAQDSRRFEHAMIKSGGASIGATKSTKGTTFSKRHKRVMQLHAMIEALDKNENELNMKDETLRAWEALACRLLLKSGMADLK